MASHSYSALYYPYIHFKDDRWLKLSALYWDRIGRIVPESYQPVDSSVVKTLGDFVETLRPGWVRPEFGINFTDFIVRRGGALRERYDIRKWDQWDPVPPWRRPPAAGGPSGTDPRLSYVFFEKMSPDLRQAMLESHIAVLDEQNPQWIGMHPRLADVYMTALADQLAAERGMHPLTDETVDHIAIGSGNIDAVARALLPGAGALMSTDNDTESVAAYVTVHAVLPKGLSEVPVDRILAFREKYPEERHRFQQRMQEFLNVRPWLNEMRDRKAVEQRLTEEYTKELKPELEALKEKLRDVNIDAITGVLSAKAEVSGLAIAGAVALGLVASPVAAAVGVALALIPIWRSRQKEQRSARRSPLAYLLRAEEELQPQDMARWLNSKATKLRLSAAR